MFGSVPGVVRTRVGYAGGTTPSPTYRSIGDHSEAIQIEYNPRVITYERLLELFWGNHNCTSPAYSRQYRAAIFVHDASQRASAEASAERLRTQGRTVQTAIEDYTGFTSAEDYHQKYYLQHNARIMRILQARYADWEAFMADPVTTRLNGYVTGQASRASVEAAMSAAGWSLEDQQELLAVLRDRAS